MAYDIRYQPPDLMVPMVKACPGIGLVPTSMARKVAAGVRGHQSISDMTHATGRNYKPRRSVLIFDPDTKVISAVLADGETEMAEIEDLAHESIERNAERMRKTGRAFDFAGARERAGLPSHDMAAKRFQDAIERRIARHRANPVTDPFRKFRYPKAPGNPVQFAMGGK